MVFQKIIAQKTYDTGWMRFCWASFIRVGWGAEWISVWTSVISHKLHSFSAILLQFCIWTTFSHKTKLAFLMPTNSIFLESAQHVAEITKSMFFGTFLIERCDDGSNHSPMLQDKKDRNKEVRFSPSSRSCIFPMSAFPQFPSPPAIFLTASDINPPP